MNKLLRKYGKEPLFYQFLRKMKLTILFLTVSILSCFSAETYSQVTKLTIARNNSTLLNVLRAIEGQSEFKFFYNEKVDVNMTVNVEATQKSVTEILDKALASSSVKYKVLGRQIALYDKNEMEPFMSEQQAKKVTGKITDQSGVAIPGVSVVVKGTTTGVNTNNDGNFTLLLPAGAKVLTFSFVGMKTQEIALGNKLDFNIVMVEEAVGLEEVVAIGYGTQKRASVTGSVASVSAAKLTIAPMASASNALTGLVPGLITFQVRGLPGADAATLSIRGFGTPLVIVDGVESNMNNIDANEIENVSVLKDASSAIYGSRAGNGVVLVTTKRGGLSKPIFLLNSTMTYQAATYLPTMNSSGQLSELQREAHLNSGKPESTAPWTQAQVDLFYKGTDPDYPNTDWFSVVARKWSPQQQHNLSVRGGSDNIKYYGFLGYLDQLSMFKNSGGEYNRYNVRSNIDAKISDNFNIRFDMSSIIENRDFPWRADEMANSVWQEFWNAVPTNASELPDKTKMASDLILTTTNGTVGGYKRTNSQKINGILSLDYRFNQVKGLSAKAYLNYDQNYSAFKMWDWLTDRYKYTYSNQTYTQVAFKSNRGLTYRDSKDRTLTGQFSLNFDRTFAEVHHVSGMALYEIIDVKSNWINAFRDGQKTFAIDYAFAGSLTNQQVNDGAAEMGRQSYVTRVNYSYKSKYLFEGTYRIDQSAKFSPDQRTGKFPSVSLGWRLSEENFIKEALPSFENLKLRASISQTGNDAVGNFQYLSGFKYGLAYIPAANASVGLVQSGLPNPFLTWETMTIYNGGLDFALNKRKLYGELDVFYRNREGIPGTRSVSLPTTFGASLPTENLNSINTRGFELIVGNEGKWRDLRWDVSANISWSRSKWGFYDEPVYTDPDQDRQSRLTGQWTDRLFGYVNEGLFTAQAEIDALPYKYNETQGNVSVKPGDIRFKDINSDGLLNWRDQIEIGKGTMPHWIGGFNLNFSYKNFDVTTLFQGAIGFYQKIVLQQGSNYTVFMYNNRWTPSNNNRNGLVPRLGGANSNTWNSDFYNKRSDYLRLKSFSLGYNLPASLIKKVSLKNVRLYVAGTNLFTLSGLNKYSIDPESMSGWSTYYYPQMRTFTFGFNVSF